MMKLILRLVSQETSIPRSLDWRGPIPPGPEIYSAIEKLQKSPSIDSIHLGIWPKCWVMELIIEAHRSQWPSILKLTNELLPNFKPDISVAFLRTFDGILT